MRSKLKIFSGILAITIAAIATNSGHSLLAAPPGSPYNPGETLSPSCAPNTTNCTVKTPANSGANSDITSLTGLTTPLSVSQGGSGGNSFTANGVLLGNGSGAIQGTTAGTANQVFRIPGGGGAPTFGAIDISQNSAITGALSVSNGGTGATTISGARSALGAAAAGANSDITSLSGLTTTLSVVQGGTGLNTISANSLLYGSGSNVISALAVGSNGQVLKISGGALTWGTDLTGGGSYTAGTAIDATSLASNTIAVDQSALSLSSIGGTLGVNKGGTGTTTSFTSGSVIFAGSGGTYSQNNSGLFWDNTNGRLGINTTSPASRLEVNGTIASTHLKGLGSAPSISAGSGAGSGATISVSGTDTAGEITLTTGALPSISSSVLTLNFANSYVSNPRVIFVPSNGLSALLSGASMIYVSTTTNNFSFTAGATALTPLSTYKWHYIVIE